MPFAVWMVLAKAVPVQGLLWAEDGMLETDLQMMDTERSDKFEYP
jgi:hypothetical protein